VAPGGVGPPGGRDLGRFHSIIRPWWAVRGGFRDTGNQSIPRHGTVGSLCSLGARRRLLAIRRPAARERVTRCHPCQTRRPSGGGNRPSRRSVDRPGSRSSKQLGNSEWPAAGSLGDRKDDTQVALCRRLREEVESRAGHEVPEVKDDTVAPLSKRGGRVGASRGRTRRGSEEMYASPYIMTTPVVMSVLLGVVPSCERRACGARSEGRSATSDDGRSG